MLKAVFTNEKAPSHAPLMIQGFNSISGGENDIMQDAQDPMIYYMNNCWCIALLKIFDVVFN